MKKEKTQPIQVSVRIDPRIIENLREEAKKAHRTINQHIGWLLENRKKGE